MIARALIACMASVAAGWASFGEVGAMVAFAISMPLVAAAAAMRGRGSSAREEVVTAPLEQFLKDLEEFRPPPLSRAERKAVRDAMWQYRMMLYDWPDWLTRADRKNRNG